MVDIQSNHYKLQQALHNYSDPSQPTYRPMWWNLSVEHWEKTLHWTGPLDDPDFKDLYLCKVPGEDPLDRATRINGTSPKPYFKDAVGDHASIFSQFEIAVDAPATLLEHQEDVDMAGSDLWAWSMGPMKALFRDGAGLLGCSVPSGQPETGKRPRLLWVPMRDVFWPEYREYDGVLKLAKVAIRRGKTTKKGLDDSLQLVNDYWVYELDENQNCFVTVWEEDKNGKLIKGEPEPVLKADRRPLQRLPFTDKLSTIGDINLTQEQQLFSPFADILNLNCEHYNARSEYDTVKRKTCLPTPVRYWPNTIPDPSPPFYAGPGTCIDFPAAGRIEYLELDGNSLPEVRLDLDNIESEIAARDNKLFHVAGGGRSATEAVIENQKAKVGLPKTKRLIESAYQDLFSIWEEFANPQPEEVGGIVISEQALSSPPDPQSMVATLSGWDRGIQIEAIISKLIRDGHYKTEDFTEPALPQGRVQNALPANLDEVIE